MSHRVVVISFVMALSLPGFPADSGRDQAPATAQKPVKYDTTSGHSGGQALEKEINDDTDMISFLSYTLR